MCVGVMFKHLYDVTSPRNRTAGRKLDRNYMRVTRRQIKTVEVCAGLI